MNYVRLQLLLLLTMGFHQILPQVGKLEHVLIFEAFDETVQCVVLIFGTFQLRPSLAHFICHSL